MLMDRTPGRVVVFKVLKSRKGCIDQYAIWWVAEYVIHREFTR